MPERGARTGRGFCMTEKRKVLETRGAALAVLLTALSVCLAACGKPAETRYTLVARRLDPMPGFALSLTLVRKFEKENWCKAEMEGLAKHQFQSECRYDETAYERMFRGEAAGVWYVIQRVGAFTPTVVIYEFNPPLPDAVVLAHLKSSAPHILKFAALHKAPAEVRIYSPTGEVH